MMKRLCRYYFCVLLNETFIIVNQFFLTMDEFIDEQEQNKEEKEKDIPKTAFLEFTLPSPYLDSKGGESLL